MFPKNVFQTDQLHVLPLGGCNEFGMNVTAYIYQKKLYLVDAGALFPEAVQLGVHALIPDISKVVRFFGGVKAYIITHGHEDHIGAMPYFFRKWQAPIYATPWTAELIRKKFSEHVLNPKTIKVVKAGQRVNLGPVKVEYVHVNHSIPDACALLLSFYREKRPPLRVFHTGDFKYDATPVGCRPMDVKHLETLGRNGVDLLLADSTNAQSPGISPSERDVDQPLEEVISKAKGRVFLTTFASNFWRLLTVSNICERLNKKLYICGRGMLNCFELATKLGLYREPPGLFIFDRDVQRLPSNKVVVLTSGSQGETRSALTRISQGEHRIFQIKKGDTVVFSARAIPGNEKSIYSLMNRLRQSGASIVKPSAERLIHVSGHAYAGDLQIMLNALQPKHYLPIHGTYTHLSANQKVSQEPAVKRVRSSLITNGDLIQVESSGYRSVAQVKVPVLAVDQESYAVMPLAQLQERLDIGTVGVFLCFGVVSARLRCFSSGPELSYRGLSFPSYGPAPQVWEKRLKSRLNECIDHWSERVPFNEIELNRQCQRILEKTLNSALGKRPVIICRFMLM